MLWLLELCADKEAGQGQTSRLVASEGLWPRQGKVSVKYGGPCEQCLVAVAPLLVELEHELHGEGAIVHLNVLEAALLVGTLQSLVLLWVQVVVDLVGLLCRSHA